MIDRITDPRDGPRRKKFNVWNSGPFPWDPGHRGHWAHGEGFDTMAAAEAHARELRGRNGMTYEAREY